MSDQKVFSTRPPYIIASTGVISIYLAGKPYSVDKSHVNYNTILQNITEDKFDGLIDLLDVGQAIRKNFGGAVDGNVEVRDGQVFYDGEAVHGSIVDRILEFSQKGLPFKPLVAFLKNLMDNPSKASVDNLYRFLDHNQHPITEDGCFLAYKAVRQDYMDVHSGKFCNKPGSVVKMPRNKVQDDPSVTCSYGLHVAALKYVQDSYSSYRVVVCKINPKDVVSVPTDYNNTKMRVCEYEVIGDFTQEIKQEEVVQPMGAALNPVDPDDDYDDNDDFDDDDDLDDDDFDDDFDDEDEDDDEDDE